MRRLIVAASMLAVSTAVQADILCTNHNGCRETGTTLRNNGGAYWHLPYAPRNMTKDQLEGKAPVQRRILRPVYN